MPAKMMNEMPLPTPRVVICSPSQIRNIVPAVSDKTDSKKIGTPGAKMPKLGD